MKKLKLLFLTIMLLFCGSILKGQTPEYSSIKELLEEVKSEDVTFTFKGLTIIHQYNAKNFLVCDANGDVIPFLAYDTGFEVGMFIPEISMTLNQNNASDLWRLYSRELSTNYQQSSGKSRNYAIPKVLSGSSSDNPTDYEYVRITGKLGSGSYYREGNEAIGKAIEIFPENEDTKYVIYNLDLESLGLEGGKTYIVYGMVNNTRLSSLKNIDSGMKVIQYFSSVKDDEAENATWQTGVYSEDESQGSCYISEIGAVGDSEGIVWEDVKEGNTVTLHAVANKGYQFKCWTFNGKEVSTEADYDVTPVSDALYCAVFEESAIQVEKSTVTITAPDSKEGIMKVNGTAVTGSSEMEFEEGEEVTFEAIAAEGYEFAGWDGIEGDDKTKNPVTIKIDGNISLSPIFKVSVKTYSLRVTVENGEGGKVRMNLGAPTDEISEEALEAGSSIELQAIANPGYEFTHWSAGDLETVTDNPYKFEISEDMEIIAVFKKVEWGVSFVAGGNGSMTVKDSEGNELKSGDKVTDETEIIVTLTPDAGYLVDELQVKRGEGEFTGVAVVDNSYTTEVNCDVEFRATFKAGIPGIFDLKVTMSENPEGDILGEVYIDNPGTTSISAKYQEEHTFYAIPNELAKFVGWKDADKSGFRSDGKELDGVYYLNWIGQGDENLVAVFDYKMTFPRKVSVKTSDESKGQVEIVGEKTLEVETRKPVTVKAVALSEYDHFENWTDGNNVIVSTEPEFTYTSEQAIELTANFYSIYPVRLSVTGGESEAYLTDSEGNKLPDENMVMENESVRIVGAAVETESLVDLRINGKSSVPTMDAGTFDMMVVVKEPLAIEVVWGPKQYNLTIESTEGGEIHVYRAVNADGTPSGARLSEAETLDHGSTIHIFPMASEGYYLTGLTVNGEDRTGDITAGAYVTHSVMSHVTVKAEFVKKTSAIDGVGEDNAGDKVEIFDMQGRRLNVAIDALRPGIYIIREGDRVRKIKVN